MTHVSHSVRPLIYERHCIHCGKVFMSSRHTAEGCSTNCRLKTWRARTKLAGTHGWLDGCWRRLPVKDKR